jgi:hypothetical protein
MWLLAYSGHKQILSHLFNVELVRSPVPLGGVLVLPLPGGLLRPGARAGAHLLLLQHVRGQVVEAEVHRAHAKVGGRAHIVHLAKGTDKGVCVSRLNLLLRSACTVLLFCCAVLCSTRKQ